MTAPGPDRLARWRAHQARVGTVGSGANTQPTPLNPQKSAIVGSVGSVGSENESNSKRAPDAWLAGIARRVRAALAEGATCEAEADGGFLLIRPNGKHLTIRPPTVTELEGAGLLPPPLRDRLRAQHRPPCWSDAEDRPEPGDRVSVLPRLPCGAWCWSADLRGCWAARMLVVALTRRGTGVAGRSAE